VQKSLKLPNHFSCPSQTAKAPVTVAVSAVAWDILDLFHGQFLRVSVSHCAYFMSKSRSFILVWHYFVNDTSHWPYQVAK
jgi:hypothetical protein